MKRIILSLISAGIISTGAQALQIIYPKTEDYTTTSDKTFFTGNDAPDAALTINSTPVTIHPSGGFYFPVKLNYGENDFEISNGKDVLRYKITRNKQTVKTTAEPEIINYKTPVLFIVDQNNAPLRSVPYDGGQNRLQHFEKGIPLSVTGEYGDFYKVQLARDDYAWISKSALKKTEITGLKPVKILSYVYDEKPDKRIFTLKLSGKTPYVLSEANHGFDLTVYNVSGYYENKYEFHINETGKPFGYKSYYKNRSELVIEIKNFPVINKAAPLKDLTVTVDAGHGGAESGAAGCLGGYEKDINLAIAQKLQNYLQHAGANVVMTRNDDSEVSLNDRVKISQDANSDIFLSIHNNALPDSLADSNRTGSGTYWFYPQSKKLAETIHKSLLTETGLADDKVRAESFAVIRNTQSPAVLIEVGYMINPEDNSKLINPEFQDKAALAIMHGLENYLNDTK